MTTLRSCGQIRWENGDASYDHSNLVHHSLGINFWKVLVVITEQIVLSPSKRLVHLRKLAFFSSYPKVV